MIELKQIIFQLVTEDATFKSLTGATDTDPRLFYTRTPKKLPVSDSKPGYVIYFKTGEIDTGNKIAIVGRDDEVFTFEIYGRTEPLVSAISYRLWQLFDEKSFESTTYIVLRSHSIGGASGWDDGRTLYIETRTLYLSHIVSKVEGS